VSHLMRYAVGLCVAGYGALQVLGRQAGSTREERRQTLPGDGAVRHPHAVTDHAITIGTPPEEVWPWLTQMGWHLGGFPLPELVLVANRMLIEEAETLRTALRYLRPFCGQCQFAWWEVGPGDVRWPDRFRRNRYDDYSVTFLGPAGLGRAGLGTRRRSRAAPSGERPR
jgi:hypothetical protein